MCFYSVQTKVANFGLSPLYISGISFFLYSRAGIFISHLHSDWPPQCADRYCKLLRLPLLQWKRPLLSVVIYPGCSAGSVCLHRISLPYVERHRIFKVPIWWSACDGTLDLGFTSHPNDVEMSIKCLSKQHKQRSGGRGSYRRSSD